MVGVAPTLRQGLSVWGYETFPYAAIPWGLRIDGVSGEFDYQTSLVLGASFPLPVGGRDKLVTSFEGGAHLGASSDYLALNLSWIWK
jgi:hypothetical protein